MSAASPSRIVRAPQHILSSLRLTPEAHSFLAHGGLPESAAPFLSFRELERGARTIYEFWGIPEKWSSDQRECLQRFRAIGSDGSGNPLCLDTEFEAQVLLLDHDDWFQTVIFVNASVIHLAEFLLLYREMVAATLLLGGQDAFLNGDTPRETQSATRAEMALIDPAALNEGAFWSDELRMAALPNSA